MTIETFLAESPRYLRFDGGTVELRLTDESELDKAPEGTSYLRSLGTGKLVAVKIITHQDYGG